MINQRDKGIKAACFILKLPKSQHVIHTMCPTLYMSEKHRGIGLLSSLVPLAMNINPLIRADLAFAKIFSGLFIKDLSTATWHRVHTTLNHLINHFIITELILTVKKIDLCGSHCLDMHIRKRFSYFSKSAHVPLYTIMRIMCRDDMHLFGTLLPGTACNLYNLLVAHRILMRIFSAGRVGTELTNISTDIGGVDMSVDIEITLFPILPLAYFICQLSQRIEIQLIKRFSLFLGQALFIAYFRYQIHSDIHSNFWVLYH